MYCQDDSSLGGHISFDDFSLKYFSETTVFGIEKVGVIILKIKLIYGKSLPKTEQVTHVQIKTCKTYINTSSVTTHVYVKRFQ